MTNILSTFPEDLIKYILSEFHKPSSKAVPEDILIKDEEMYEQGIYELSKLHEIQQNYPPDVAISTMKELNIPKNIIKLVIQSQQNALVNNNGFAYTWRLDQSVPNVQAVLFNIKDRTSSETKTMRMDLSTFHKLRFNVALLLKEHDTLSKRVHKE